MNTMDGNACLFGAFFQGDLIAVGAVKERRHILLLYVLPEWEGKGVGSALLLRMEKYCLEKKITLNSSDGAVAFYQKHGYQISAPRRVEDDMIFTPMIKILKF